MLLASTSDYGPALPVLFFFAPAQLQWPEPDQLRQALPLFGAA
jgi:hypothetical protein